MPPQELLLLPLLGLHLSVGLLRGERNVNQDPDTSSAETRSLPTADPEGLGSRRREGKRESVSVEELCS